MTEVNVPLLRKVVEWVEEQNQMPVSEREWDQGVWVRVKWTQELGQAHACGTAYCLAGYVGQMVDERFTTEPWVEHEDGSITHVKDVAANALGLTPVQAYWLFRAGNCAATIRTVAEEYAGEKL